MKNILVSFICLFMVQVSLAEQASSANDILIDEMESLLTTLDYKDRTRVELVRRLADLYYKESVNINKDNVLKGITSPTEKLVSYRNRAIELFEDALTGAGGKAKAPKGALKSVIHFQIARLHEAKTEPKKAAKIYDILLKDEEAPNNIKRESAIKLAEITEQIETDDKADKFFKLAIKFCDNVDNCSYAHYRRGWLLYRNGKPTEAVAETKKALWDSKGQIQEQVLSDYIVFMAQTGTDGRAELAEIKELSTKLGRTDLVAELANSYFSAGNRIAGTTVLSHISKDKPGMYISSRLAEEYYGFRNWEGFREQVATLRKMGQEDFPKHDHEAKEVKEIVKRLAAQLDGEVKTQKQYKDDLQNVISIYLTLYPKDQLRQKMVDGWLNVEKDLVKKVAQLKLFIADEVIFNNVKEEIRLREMRVSLAQKLKNEEIILAESKTLSEISETEDKKTQFRYLFAYTLYKQNKLDQALGIFKEMAVLKEGVKPGKFAIQSQNLVLDILNEKKDFAGIAAQAALWTARTDLSSDKKLSKELKQMGDVATQARFEQAVAMGTTPEALAVFEEYCYGGTFVKKSCPNVKVLAIKLAKQDSVIKILKYNKDEKSLMVEYERMGQFADAAKLLEKHELSRKSELPFYLKLATMFELDSDITNRDRILNKMIKKIKRDKKMPAELEGVIYTTLIESGFFSSKLLSMPWAPARKMGIVLDLEQRGVGSKLSRKLLLSSKENMGQMWEEHRVKPVVHLFNKQKKIGFYGRASKRRFQRRVKALNKFVAKAKSVLEITTPKTRVYLGNMMVTAYKDLADEVVNMPIPKIIEDQEQRAMIKKNFENIAKPFADEAVGYQTMVDEQVAQIETEEEKAKVTASLEMPYKEFFAQFKKSEFSEYKKDVATLDISGITSAREKLLSSPDDRESLIKLEKFYRENGFSRLAAYFKGRTLSDDNQGAKL